MLITIYLQTKKNTKKKHENATKKISILKENPKFRQKQIIQTMKKTRK